MLIGSSGVSQPLLCIDALMTVHSDTSLKVPIHLKMTSLGTLTLVKEIIIK